MGDGGDGSGYDKMYHVLNQNINVYTQLSILSILSILYVYNTNMYV